MKRRVGAGRKRQSERNRKTENREKTTRKKKEEAELLAWAVFTSIQMTLSLSSIPFVDDDVIEEISSLILFWMWNRIQIIYSCLLLKRDHKRKERCRRESLFCFFSVSLLSLFCLPPDDKKNLRWSHCLGVLLLLFPLVPVLPCKS